mmetsp:Transcript_92496/g.235149  ORF Transcript_92496/g.235149 Transcript_92496/m.235149 type:complete len:446 (-) Transcript_92496:77-1414(-)
MSSVLTGHLHRAGHLVRACDEWSVDELKGLQRKLHGEAHPELLAVYEAASDNRRQRSSSKQALEAHWTEVDAAVAEGPAHLAAVRRDGLCHEVVMSWAHHLTSGVQQRLVREGVEVPSLPQQRHTVVGALQSPAERRVMGEYRQQVSCQQCHTGKISDATWQDASLPAPPPVDKAHPGMERQRQCDFQAKPPCGPCDGLGGQRSGDGVEDMVPLACEVLADASTAPKTKGRYPALATAQLTGETRTPLAVRPAGPGKYIPLGGTLYLGWQGDFMRMRYDFGGLGSQVSVQTYEQARNMSTGATMGIGGGKCECDRSIAGNMHIQSFDPEDPLDRLKLPANQGGAAYLGRVRVKLDGSHALSNGTAVADHYMNWAFHFLVDADEASPSFGLPLRLYGPYGVRQVFDSWVIGDPSKARPDIWQMPKGCAVKAPECSVFVPLAEEIVV